MLSARAYSFHQKSKLAISLSWIGGYTNAVMVAVCGMFVSNMTGSSTSFGMDLAHGQFGLAGLFAFLIGCFFVGALASGVMTELARRGGRRSKYVVPMAIEGAILSVLAIAVQQHHAEPLGTLAWHVLSGLACFAMGLQNATVTEISGAVIRTTHLTGVITDIGLETVRVSLWAFDQLRSGQPRRIARVARIATREPGVLRLALLASIFGSFIFGTVMGALAYVFIPSGAMLPPVLFILTIILMDWRKPIADVREIDPLSDAELQLHGIVHSLLPRELGLYRLSHHRDDLAHHPPDFHHWAEKLHAHWRVIVLAISPMTVFGTNAVADLRDIVEKLHADDRDLVLAGVTAKQYHVLTHAGLLDALEPENICTDIEFAIARAIDRLHQLQPRVAAYN